MRDLNIGAVMPSTRFIVRRVIEAIPFERITFILEFGAGEGVVTRAVLKRMKDNAAIIVFEPNKSMRERLELSVHDDRLRVVQDVAENAEKYTAGKKFDLILASNPFSKLKDRRGFIKDITKKLQMDGRLIIFNQHIPIGLRADLRSYFKCIRVEWEPRNVPPCFNFICTDPICVEDSM